jgi:hypothetical protein
MLSKKKSMVTFCLLTVGTIAGLAAVSSLYAEPQHRSIELSQEVFALEKKTMNIDLVINTSTLEFQDLNNNRRPDVGETSIVLGKLYAPNTQNEIGTYRASFIWGNWANSTEGAPISLGTQVFDIRDNGTVIAVGDIVTDARNGNATALPIPIAAAIAGGTGKYHGVGGTTIVTERYYEPGTALFLNVVLEITRVASSSETTRT